MVENVRDDVAVLQGEGRCWSFGNEEAGILNVEDVGIEPAHPGSELGDLFRVQTFTQLFCRFLAAKLPHPLSAEKVVNQFGKTLEQGGQLAFIPRQECNPKFSQEFGLVLEFGGSRPGLKTLLGTKDETIRLARPRPVRERFNRVSDLRRSEVFLTFTLVNAVFRAEALSRI